MLNVFPVDDGAFSLLLSDSLEDCSLGLWLTESHTSRALKVLDFEDVLAIGPEVSNSSTPPS